jgi:hypothetical protein
MGSGGNCGNSGLTREEFMELERERAMLRT